MPHGGARPGTGGKREGAGRKPGGPTKRAREALEETKRTGLTPLEVMLCVMRKYFNEQEYGPAVEVAQAAAPYVHPKLSAMLVNSDVTHHLVPVFVEVPVDVEAIPDKSGIDNSIGLADNSTADVLEEKREG